jgi:hypothetical protein
VPGAQVNKTSCLHDHSLQSTKKTFCLGSAALGFALGKSARHLQGFLLMIPKPSTSVPRKNCGFRTMCNVEMSMIQCCKGTPVQPMVNRCRYPTLTLATPLHVVSTGTLQQDGDSCKMLLGRGARTWAGQPGDRCLHFKFVDNDWHSDCDGPSVTVLTNDQQILGLAPTARQNDPGFPEKAYTSFEALSSSSDCTSAALLCSKQVDLPEQFAGKPSQRHCVCF